MTGLDPVAQARAIRWAGQPEAEAEYEARCAYWESLTAADVVGPAGALPSWPEFRDAWFAARKGRAS